MLLTKFPLGVQHVHHFSLTRGFGNWLGYSARIEEKRYRCTFPRCVPGLGWGRLRGRREDGGAQDLFPSVVRYPIFLPIEIRLFNQASVNKVFFKLKL